MLDTFGICVICNELIETKAGLWRDADGHSFSLTGEGDGFRYHRHSPVSKENYDGIGKYGCIEAEILDNLALLGYAYDSIGDQSNFGFFDYFPDYRMILTSHPDGYVSVAEFQDYTVMRRTWDDIVSEYETFDNESSLYDEYGDDEYAYESGAYESDLWD